jgi:hypothetical protein
MTVSPDRWHEFDLLVDRVIDGIGSRQERRRLNQLLRGDEDACRRYLEYMGIHSRLLWHDERIERDAAAAGTPSALPAKPVEATVEPLRGGASAVPAVFGAFVFNLSPSALPAGAILCYAIAGLILGAMILGALNRDAASTRQIAKAKIEAGRPDLAGKVPLFTARITGMNDCRWADLKTAAGNATDVRLGQTFALRSGELEITYYRSGAKVVVVGPAVYRVDAPNGGFLQIGRLTFYTASRPAAPGKSLPPPAANTAAEKFYIHTPNPDRPNVIIINQADGVLTVDSKGNVFARALSPTVLGMANVRLTPVPLLGMLVGMNKNRQFVVAIEKSRIRPATAAEAAEAAATCREETEGKKAKRANGRKG